MPRFLLFAGDDINPHGGWDDYITSGETIDELESLLTWNKTKLGWQLIVNHERWDTDSITGHWYHIVDMESMDVVRQETSFKMRLNEKDR